MRGAQAALSPVLGAPATPAAWQAGARCVVHRLALAGVSAFRRGGGAGCGGGSRGDGDGSGGRRLRLVGIDHDFAHRLQPFGDRVLRHRGAALLGVAATRGQVREDGDDRDRDREREHHHGDQLLRSLDRAGMLVNVDFLRHLVGRLVRGGAHCNTLNFVEIVEGRRARIQPVRARSSEDRVLASEAKGRGFESRRARQNCNVSDE